VSDPSWRNVWKGLLVVQAALTTAVAVWVLWPKPRAAPPLPVAAPAVVVAAPPSPADQLARATSLAEALPVAIPTFGDSADGSLNPGALLFAMWASGRLSWGDIQGVRPVTYGAAAKDPEEERGRRLCASGELIQIEAERLVGTRFFWGLLGTPSGIIKFHAFGSSGDLVAESPAKFCGVFVGKYDYPNSAGGTGHALTAVGMFDLPENRTLNR
jgi:hypothetical protein